VRKQDGEPLQNGGAASATKTNLLSHAGNLLVMFFIATMTVPGVIFLMVVITGYLMWCMMFWLYEQLERPIKSVMSGMIGLLVFCKNAAPLVSILSMLGLLVGACGGGTSAAVGGVLGFALGIFIEMVRQLEADASAYNRNPYPEREREEVGWGSEGDGYWYGGTTSYSPPVRHTVWNHGPIKVKTYRNPWAWQGFQTKEGPKEDNMRMDL
jgi:hypothetical protein